MKSLLPLCFALFLSTQTTYGAVQGGIGGGGGSEIESGFRVKVISLLRQAQAMTPEQKQLLKFNPTTAVARLAMPNAFKPLCGNDQEAAQLKHMNKMAFVNNPASGVVTLDCTNYSLADWQSLYNSQQPEKAPFFLHETMRVLSIADDDYSVSSSFLDAVAANPQAEGIAMAEAMQKLITKDPGSKRCSVVVWGSMIVFGMDGRKLDRVRYYGVDKLTMEGMLISPEPIINSENIYDISKDQLQVERYRKLIYGKAKSAGCI